MEDAADADMPPCEPPKLQREVSDGVVPLIDGTEIEILHKDAHIYDDSSDGAPWFGVPITFMARGDKWTLDSYVGFGTEGQTYLGTNTSTGTRSVVKFVAAGSGEVKVVRKLPKELCEHPNLLSYELVVLNAGPEWAPTEHIIFMEYVPNGELFDFILNAPDGPINEGTSRRFLQDVIRGLAACYRHGFTHRDLKPENLLLNAEGRIIIIDLGHAKRVKPVNPPVPSPDGELLPPPCVLVRTTTCNAYGTENFNAPEVEVAQKRGKIYDCEKSDVWSLGVIAYMLYAKTLPFGARGVASWTDISGPANLHFWGKSGKYLKDFPYELKQFINALWRKEPDDRPSFRHLELAIDGDSDTLDEFEGLKWLATPLGSQEDFVRELKRCCPDIGLSFPDAAKVDQDGGVS